MRTSHELLSDLRRRGVKLWTEGDRLRFTAPRGAVTASLRSEMAQRKPELLTFLRQAAEGMRTGPPPIRRLPRRGALPLSFAQRRLWFLDQLQPATAAYTIFEAIGLAGDLDVATLERALTEVVRRHETLRTTFSCRQGRPEQVVQAPAAWRLPVVDLQALAAADHRGEVRRQARRVARRPFDPERGPLLRTPLLRTDGRHHVLLVAMHHIISDGASVENLIRELGILYAAFRAGRPSPLGELAVQYADFAAWQRRWLSDDVLEQQLQYWRERLDGLPGLELPTDRPRPVEPSSRGAALEIALSPALSAAVRDLARRLDATLFMTFLAAFQLLLGRYSGQRDVAVGAPIAQRRRKELEPLIGLLVNNLVMRADLSDDPSFAELARRVREAVLGAFAHQDLPFEQLVADLRPDRDRSRNPLFQVVFSMTAVPPRALALPGLTLEDPDVGVATTRFDWELHVIDQGDHLRTALIYSTDLFDASTIARALRYLQTLLEGAVADARARTGDLPLWRRPERHQVLVEWTDTATRFPRESTVHALFAARARRRGDAVAAACGGEGAWPLHLTYAALDGRAETVAGRLRRSGAVPRPGARVGLCADATLDVAVGSLAILKAGGAYVPLDPAYPPARLALMLADTGAAAVLTRKRLLGVLPPRTPAVFFDGSPRLEPDGAAAATPGRPEDLAYVIYTSGSTGRPKGSAVPHRAVVRLVCDTDYVRLAAGDRVAQVSSFAFDALTFELWGALLSGGCLVGVGREVALSPSALAAWIRAQRIDAMFLTTALANQVARHRPEGFAPLRDLLIGGEALDPGRIREILAASPPARLSNAYGPTESTTFACCQRVREVPEGAATVPIGRPIANTTACVFDPRGRPLPVGIPGELHLGGDGLARGYLGRPGPTAEKFVPHPSSAAGDRLYRTGDLTRLRPDGAIEFLGRIDQQLKIRGFRIEPGEIEAVLGEHPAIAASVVVPRRDGPDDRRLVAYVVARGEVSRGELSRGDLSRGDLSRGDLLRGDLSPARLREHLKAKLPDYMVPAAFVRLETLPLTANGKVDRKALRLAEPTEPGERTAGTDAAPRDPVEEILAGIWSEVLGVDRVGVEDDFFELGGHSLLATRVISRVRRHLQVDLPLGVLFESPTVAAAAAAIAAAGRKEGPETAPIPPRPATDSGGSTRDVGPPSFAQERLWFLDRLAPGNTLYNIPLALRLVGELDVEALRRSFEEIVRRHEVLRTTFTSEHGDVRQVLHPPAGWRLPVVDLSHLAPPRRELEGRRLVREASDDAFDLARGPLLRTLLLRGVGGPPERRTSLLLFTIHHIVADGWSIAILVRELTALYPAFRERRGAPLEPLTVQYSDYTRWQRRWAGSEDARAQLDYWRRQLEGAPNLELPADRPRPPTRTFRGSSSSFRLSAELSRSLRRLSRASGATLFMTLLAAFKALLRRVCGEHDLCVGTVVAHRNRAEIEGLVGCFVNTLVLRTDAGGDPTFTELLERVRSSALGAYAHQDLPFERLVAELATERDLSRTPLFQVMFILQNTPQEELELPGLLLETLEAAASSSQFDLTVQMVETPGGLEGSLTYDIDLFAATTIRRLAGSFETLLEAVAAGPGQRLSRLPLMSNAQRHRLLAELNDTARVGAPARAPGEVPLHQLVADQAAGSPDAVALVFERQHLTYAGLRERTRRLARHLRALGVADAEPVGVCLERSPDLVISVLAVLESGGAFLPLDPGYPQERLDFMLEDSGVSAVLTRSSLGPRLGAARRAVCLDTVLGAVRLDPDARRAGDRPAVAAAGTRPESLAYLIYTSGSTGRPKGVLIHHRGLSNLQRAQRAALGLRFDDRVLQFASLSFDASISEIAMTLPAGACLVMVRRETAASLVELERWLKEARVTVATLPPSLLALLPPRLPALRRMISAGEACSAELVRRWGVGRTFVNAYGPSEVTVCATMGRCHEEPSIGLPIANQTAHLLDDALRLAPDGVPGELWVGGVGVGRGYHARPALTAERFLPDPFSAFPGARLYRTGDLARRTGGGGLLFLGRLDNQMKVRGHRIEPEEIEAALSGHPAVGACAVVLREDRPGDLRLTAYYTAEGAEPSAGELRRHLGAKLPSYMVPSTFVPLDELPFAPSRKIDRAALRRRAPGPAAGTPRAAPYVPPSGPVAVQVAEIWRALLGVERVGSHDDFFALGGHSLDATRMVSRLRDVFGVEVELRRLFETPTVAGLAAAVETASGPSRAVPAITPIERDGDLPLSFGQERLWFLDRLAPDGGAYNMPGALRLGGRLRLAALARSLMEIVRRHEVLRTTFADRDGRPHQIVHPPPTAWALPVVDLRALAPEARAVEAQRLATEEARRRFDLARGPLLRSRVVRLADDDHVLLATLHHIVADGWSVAVLARELTVLYAAMERDSGAVSSRRPPLPELPIQYADYAVWQRRWLRGGVLADEVAAWREQLAGARTLELPTDFPRPAVLTHRGASHPLTLAPELCRTLRDLGHARGATLFMTLLAAFEALLHRVTGQHDFLVGSPVAGRRRSETEPLIGFFVNTLALRADLSGNPRFSELLERTRRTAVAAYAHQDVPFERLVEALDVPRDPGRPPLFQVMFVFHNAPVETLELGGLAVEPLEVANATALFDLTLNLGETPAGVAGSLDYNTDLFAAETAARWAEDYVAVLAAVVSDPERRLAGLPVALTPERPTAAPPGGRPAPRQLPRRGDQAPTGSLERRVAEVWKELLGLREVGRHDNFFDLGGHSLLVSQVHSRLHRTIAPGLAMVKLFEHPTIASLAAFLEQRAPADAEDLGERLATRHQARRQQQRRRWAARRIEETSP